MAVEVKLARDQAEVDKMDKALARLERSEGTARVTFLKQVYFEGCSLDDMAELEGCSLSTIQRRRSSLVRVLALILYGAEALL